MQVELDYGQCEGVLKSMLQTDYAMLQEGVFAFDSEADEQGLRAAYEVVMRWYGLQTL